MGLIIFPYQITKKLCMDFFHQTHSQETTKVSPVNLMLWAEYADLYIQPITLITRQDNKESDFIFFYNY